MPISRSAACQCHKKWISIKMREQFKLSPRCQRLWAINPSMPSLRFRRDTQGLEHWKVSLLIQLRTGHVPLQVHLSRIGKKDSPVCPMCHKVDKTVSHFITACTVLKSREGAWRGICRGPRSQSACYSQTQSVKNTGQIVIQCSGRSTLSCNKITTWTNSNYVKVILSLRKDKSGMKYSLQCSGRSTEAESETTS